MKKKPEVWGSWYDGTVFYQVGPHNGKPSLLKIEQREDETIETIVGEFINTVEAKCFASFVNIMCVSGMRFLRSPDNGNNREEHDSEK